MATYVRSHRDLITPPEITRKGFLEQALSKNEKVKPFIGKAKVLYAELQKTQKPENLIGNKKIHADLITAAGFSDKSIKYFNDDQLAKAVIDVIKIIGNQAGSNWREEIVYRFLLIRGDSLGGEMRNLAGAKGPEEFIKVIEDTLNKHGIESNIVRSETAKSKKVQKIEWDNRILLFDKKPPLIGNSVDVILLKNSYRSRQGTEQELLSRKDNYLACGEIKSGIDPAGADEHWKTAFSALQFRLRQVFIEQGIPLFFLGRAIESNMAQEIFRLLESGELAHAANLTKPKQVSELTSWLISI